jgi:FeS assembly SUF system protein
MGMFSFLKEKEKEAAAAAASAAQPSTESQGPSAAMPAAHDSTMATAPTAHAGATPFVPPAAWDTSALGASQAAASPESNVGNEKPAIGPLDRDNTAELQQAIIDTIKTVYDPEIPVDIYELGLIYDIRVDAEKRVLIEMTLTSPACPSAQQIPNEVRWKVKAVPGVTDAWVEIVWEPMWTKDRMSEAAKLQLGFF